MKMGQQPEWRWERAKTLLQHDANPSRRIDDKHVHQAHRFLTRYRKDDFTVVQRLAVAYPSLYEAYQIYSEEMTTARWILEAAIMSKLSAVELAEMIRTDVEVIEAYEFMFFDVRPALEHPLCICANVLLPAAQNGSHARDYDFLWKFLAFYGGWKVVEQMWTVGAMPEEVETFFKRALEAKIIRDGLSAAHQRVITQFNANEVVEQAMNMVKMQAEKQDSVFASNVDIAMRTVMASVGVAVAKSRDLLPAEEPRAFELMKMGGIPQASVVASTQAAAKTLAEGGKPGGTE
jgi:hypothetical protein